MNKKKLSYKKIRMLIHGGKYANVVNHQQEIKTQNERMRINELAGKSIIVDRSKLSLPSGKYGKLIVHNGNGKTRSALCFENHIPQFLQQVTEPTSGLFIPMSADIKTSIAERKKFKVSERGEICWME